MRRSYSAEIEKLAKLETFDARAFIADDKVTQQCCDVALALAVAFNDIKDLLLADHLLLGEAPEDQRKPSRELGAFAGLHVHFFRVLLGVLHEILYLLQTEKSILDVPIFSEVIKKLPVKTRKAWNKLVVASSAKTSVDSDVRFLVVARNSVAYHYGSKAIGQGYRRAFATGDDPPFLSRGTSIATTRFYFADRATQSYLQQVFGENELERYFLKEPRFVSEVAASLYSVVTGFVNTRGFGWRNTPAG